MDKQIHMRIQLVTHVMKEMNKVEKVKECERCYGLDLP